MKNDSISARASRRSASAHSFLKLACALLILLVLNYIGFRHYYHRDLSLSQFYTLSPKTVSMIKSLDSPLTIYTFLDPTHPAQSEQISTLLKEYAREGGKNIAVEKIDQNFDITRAMALQKKLHFDGNDYLVMFEYKDRPPRFVKEEDFFDLNPMTQQMGAFKGEQQITAALTSLIEGKASKVYFTEGHGEHSIQDSKSPTGYGILVATLKNDNVATSTLNLAQTGDVPSDAEAVVIAGPSISFSPIEVETLQKYLAGNGKLLIMLDPYVVSGLDDLLKTYGIKYENDLVLYRVMDAAGASMTMPLALIYQRGFALGSPITEKFGQSGLQLMIQNTRSMTGDEAFAQKTIPLLQTDQLAWGWFSKPGVTPPDPRTLTYNKVTDLPGPLTIAAAYDGGMITDPATKATGTATRVVAVGSSRFIQNDTADTVGSNFFTNSIDWLVKKNAILEIAPKKPQEYGVALNPPSYRTVLWCALIFFPGIALLLGVATWYSRRK